MQVGWFGTSLIAEISHSKKGRFEPLINYLTKFYPKEHSVRILQAPFNRNDRPVAITTKLGSLDRYHKTILPIMSLFIPALPDGEEDSSSINLAFVRNTEDKEHLRAIADLGD
jgi:hypothetical protein